jgi:hypothetical protein
MSTPFEFATSADLVEITGRQAVNLGELLRLLREAEPAAVFHHTYQTMREHHFLLERYPNDFADWVHTACGEASLAERLAGIDLRAHLSLRSLQAHFVHLVEEHLERAPSSRTRPAREPFELCKTISVVTPTGDRAETLEEFRAVIARASTASIHHHFVTARLRLDLASNDFSYWLKTALDRHDLAERLDRIDIVMQTLAGIRESIVKVLA